MQYLGKLPNIFLAILSGLLLAASWIFPFTFLIFIAWIPLLIVEQKISESLSAKRKSLKITGLSYLTFFIWNILTTWWIYYASFGGLCLAVVTNSLLMSIVFTTYFNIKKRINISDGYRSWGIWLLVPLWLGFEYGHTLWDLSWTWLTLGNVFAFAPDVIQWYEFTGTSGGSLWVLIINILLFRIINPKPETRNLKLKLIAIFFIPIIFSFIIKMYRSSKLSTINNKLLTVIVQPNVDPYNEKFNLEPKVQLQNLLKQIKGKLNNETDYLVMPETYLTEYVNESYLENSASIKYLQDSILFNFPNLTIITGASTMREFISGEKIPSTARKFSNADAYYDSYNTAIQINKEGIKLYHKSKLVPGVERMPFPVLFKPLEKLAINLGGTMGSLGTQDERTVFFRKNNSVGIAPVICYESVYPDYVGQYIRNGANIIFIITNDGWWDDTPGYKHHLAYARLRAIETRCQIARCANTGISCFIDELGNIEQATKWWEQAAIQKDLNVSNGKTFFVRCGDLISYISSAIALLFFGYGQILRFRKR